MHSLQGNQVNFNNKISYDFSGGNLSSDTGLLAYRSFDEKIGLTKLVKDYLKEFELSQKSYTFKSSDVILQNIYKTLAGYHTGVSSNELMTDPLFNQIVTTNKLASQPVVSRRSNDLNIDTFKSMENVNMSLLDRSYTINPPEHVIFDIDSTNIGTSGKQHGSAFNYHYGCNGFHPLLLFDGVTGDLIKAELRSGNVYTSRNVVSFMGPVIKHYRSNYKNTYLVIRGDSGFAHPELYNLAETHNVAYCIRLKANQTLANHVNEALLDFNFEYSHDYSRTHTSYGEFMYQAKSWTKARRVCFKLQRKAGELLPTATFVVTTMEAEPKDVIKFYSKRGNMENFIKEIKTDFGMDTLSHTSYLANVNKMMQIALAYNINNLMRRLCFPDNDKKDRMSTLRTKLVKIASRFVSSSRYHKYKLCSSYLYKNFFISILNRIDQLPCLV